MKRVLSAILSAVMLTAAAALPAYAREALPGSDGSAQASGPQGAVSPQFRDECKNAAMRLQLRAFAPVIPEIRAAEIVTLSLYKLLVSPESSEAQEHEEQLSAVEEAGVPLARAPDGEGPFRLYVLGVIEFVNAERAKAGLPLLTETEALKNAAAARAAELETLFSHNRPGGDIFATVLEEFDATALPSAENIGAGYTDSQQIVAAWMSREGHRHNILNPDYTKVGAGVHSDRSGRLYWELLLTA